MTEVVVAPINEELYKKLSIDLGPPEALRTKKGIIIFPSNVKRENAWICAYCGKTPYEDPLNTRAELLDNFLDDSDDDPIPLAMYVDTNQDGQPDKELTFHFSCARDLGLLDNLTSRNQSLETQKDE